MYCLPHILHASNLAKSHRHLSTILSPWAVNTCIIQRSYALYKLTCFSKAAGTSLLSSTKQLLILSLRRFSMICRNTMSSEQLVGEKAPKANLPHGAFCARPAWCQGWKEKQQAKSEQQFSNSQLVTSCRLRTTPSIYLEHSS
jgi:hypothetical protein